MSFIQELHKEMKTQDDAEKILALLTRGQVVGGFASVQSDQSEKETPEETKLC